MTSHWSERLGFFVLGALAAATVMLAFMGEGI
jgi:hypothetical protein